MNNKMCSKTNNKLLHFLPNFLRFRISLSLRVFYNWKFREPQAAYKSWGIYNSHFIFSELIFKRNLSHVCMVFRKFILKNIVFYISNKIYIFIVNAFLGNEIISIFSYYKINRFFNYHFMMHIQMILFISI